MIRDTHERRDPTDWSVGVVVPARDEERLIRRCLTAIAVAGALLRRERPLTSLCVVVVLDSCTDATGDIAAEFPDVLAVPIAAGRVGMARAAGISALAQALPDPGRTWVASTDADSAVPETWLLDQLELADAGAELVTGFVATDLADTPDELRGLAPTATHIPDGHHHVYGANLGFTLETYLALGGFAPLPAHEDVAFVERARRRGVRSHASGSICVLTSGRTEGRAPEGYAAYLRTLAHLDLATESA